MPSKLQIIIAFLFALLLFPAVCLGQSLDQRVVRYCPAINGSTYFASGGSGITLAGNGTNVYTGNYNLIPLTTAASTGTTATATNTTNFNTRIGSGSTCTFVMNPNTASNVRYWIGLLDTHVITGNDTPGSTSAANGLLFRYSTAIPDTNWQAVSCNGTTQTVTDTGIVFASGTPIVFQIDSTSSSSIKLYINGTLAGTLTTNLPGSTVDMGVYCTVTTLTNSAATLQAGAITILTK